MLGDFGKRGDIDYGVGQSSVISLRKWQMSKPWNLEVNQEVTEAFSFLSTFFRTHLVGT